MPPDRIETALGVERFDVAGRLIIAHCSRLAVAVVGPTCSPILVHL